MENGIGQIVGAIVAHNHTKSANSFWNPIPTMILENRNLKVVGWGSSWEGKSPSLKFCSVLWHPKKT